MTPTEQITMKIFGTLAVIGIAGTVIYAQKAADYRKKLIKNIVGFETVNHLLFRSKTFIDDPEKLKAFEAEMESSVKLAGDLNKAL